MKPNRREFMKVVMAGSVAAGYPVDSMLAAAHSQPQVQSGGKTMGCPAPRFPSYLNPGVKPTLAEVMPNARVLASATGGVQGVGMGHLNPGQTMLIVTDVTAEPLMVEAVEKALKERKINTVFLPDYTFVGATREEAEEVRRATVIPGANYGYLEARNYWIADPRVWSDESVPVNYLKQKSPYLYEKLFPKRTELPASLQGLPKKFTLAGMGPHIADYLTKHPEINAVYWGKYGGGFYGRYMAPFESKFMGMCPFTNHWDLMSELPTYPADVFHLIEAKTLAPLADAAEVHITGAEGTDIGWEVPEEMAKRWSHNAYWRGHLLMFPDSATGQYSYSFEHYPQPHKHWTPREPIAMVNGVVAGTNGSGGFFPRMEIHFKDATMSEVKGGGIYGDVIREFMNYPHINDLTYPYYNHPGYWHLWELALGTLPKYFRNPSDFYGSGHAGVYCLTYERYRSGVFHWGFGNEMPNEPGSYGPPKKWNEFCTEHKLPAGHDFHIHNYFITYKLRRRSTGEWVTLVDKGHLTALDDPEVRALAARHGDPDKILAEDWIPEVPGINVPGSYADYGKDPWQYANAQMKRILAGTYEHYYPKPQTRK